MTRLLSATSPDIRENALLVRLLYLFSGSLLVANDAASRLRQFGFAVRAFTSVGTLSEYCREAPPSAVLIDLSEVEAERLDEMACPSVRMNLGAHIPLVIISPIAGLNALLRGVRAGADIFYSRPIDLAAVAKHIHDLIQTTESRPYRILIATDSMGDAVQLEHALGAAALSVETVANPIDLLSALHDSRPDLVLVGYHRQVFSSAEIINIIRLNNVDNDVPVLLLASDGTAHRGKSNESGYADGILYPPFSRTDVAASVIRQARRYRELRSLIMRDGLTGLYNQSAVKDLLKKEASNCIRRRERLAVALLDIDRFKGINDTYGHIVGDHVIQSLARTLQAELRRTDIVGRYGGEEFALIFPGTAAVDAFRALNHVRDRFSKVSHFAGQVEFRVSFSAGVADVEDLSNSLASLEMADKALYLAKNTGRNRIELAVQRDVAEKF